MSDRYSEEWMRNRMRMREEIEECLPRVRSLVHINKDKTVYFDQGDYTVREIEALVRILRKGIPFDEN